MIHRPIKVLALVVLAALAACTSATTERPAERPPSTVGACPLGVPGASVDLQETPQGVALVFTSPEHVDELRERARYAAAMHGPDAHLGAGHDGSHGSGGQHGLQAMQLPPVHAAVVDVDGGARIELVPTDADDRVALLEKTRDGVNRMRTSACR